MPSEPPRVPSRRHLILGAAGGAFLPGLGHAEDRPLAVEVDTDDFPQFAAAGHEMKRRAASWWPIINEALASPGYRPPNKVTLHFTKFLPDNVVGRAVGDDAIELNANFFEAHPIATHPHLYTVLAHELAHVAQHYPPLATKWLTEGIADYVRFYVLFPDDPARFFDPMHGDFRTGYQPAAAMLDHVERTCGMGSVRQVNAYLRKGRDGEGALAKVAGMPPEDVWNNVLTALTDGSPVPRA